MLCSKCSEDRYHPDHHHGPCQCACNIDDDDRSNPFNGVEGFVNVPIPFDGSEEELARNFRSHTWFDGECMECIAPQYGTYAYWPCGTPAPRGLVRHGSKSAEMAQLRPIIGLAARAAVDELRKKEQ